jgi:hypothetical protein
MKNKYKLLGLLSAISICLFMLCMGFAGGYVLGYFKGYGEGASTCDIQAMYNCYEHFDKLTENITQQCFYEYLKNTT